MMLLEHQKSIRIFPRYYETKIGVLTTYYKWKQVKKISTKIKKDCFEHGRGRILDGFVCHKVKNDVR